MAKTKLLFFCFFMLSNLIISAHHLLLQCWHSSSWLVYMWGIQKKKEGRAKKIIMGCIPCTRRRYCLRPSWPYATLIWSVARANQIKRFRIIFLMPILVGWCGTWRLERAVPRAVNSHKLNARQMLMDRKVYSASSKAMHDDGVCVHLCTPTSSFSLREITGQNFGHDFGGTGWLRDWLVGKVIRLLLIPGQLILSLKSDYTLSLFCTPQNCLDFVCWATGREWRGADLTYVAVLFVIAVIYRNYAFMREEREHWLAAV